MCIVSLCEFSLFSLYLYSFCTYFKMNKTINNPAASGKRGVIWFLNAWLKSRKVYRDVRVDSSEWRWWWKFNAGRENIMMINKLLQTNLRSQCQLKRFWILPSGTENDQFFDIMLHGATVNADAYSEIFKKNCNNSCKIAWGQCTACENKTAD